MKNVKIALAALLAAALLTGCIKTSGSGDKKESKADSKPQTEASSSETETESEEEKESEADSSEEDSSSLENSSTDDSSKAVIEPAQPTETTFKSVEGYWYINGETDAGFIFIDGDTAEYMAFLADGVVESMGTVGYEKIDGKNWYTLSSGEGDYYLRFADDGTDQKTEFTTEQGVRFVLMYGKGGLGDDGRGDEETAIMFDFKRITDGDAKEYAVITAEDIDGNPYWQYTTEKLDAAQLTRVEEIGNLDHGYLFNAGGTIYCLDNTNANEPVVLWKNDEFGGASIKYDFDNLGNLYICGYFGPFLMKVSSDGKTLYYRQDNPAGEDNFWPSELYWNGGDNVEITFESSGNTIIYNIASETIQ